jgi:hypothetical protein
VGIGVTMIAATGAAALFVALVARRGVRVDDHPVCRRCGFDLFGRPDGSARCAECGNDFTKPRAVRRGNRERWSGVAATATLVMLASIAWLGIRGWRYVRGVGASDKPTMWLMRDMRSRNPTIADAAMQELCLRWNQDELEQEQADRLVDMILAVQQDTNRRWLQAWQDAVEAAHSARRLDEGRWRRYWEQAWAFQLEIRPAVRTGDRLLMRLTSRAVRPRITGPREIVSFSVAEVRIDGGTCPCDDYDVLSDGLLLRGGRWGGRPRRVTRYVPAMDRPSVPTARETGKHRVEVVVKIQVSRQRTGDVAEILWTVVRDVEYLDGFAALSRSAAWSHAASSGFSVRAIEMVPGSRGAWVGINAVSGPSVAPIVGELSIRQGTREWSIASLAISGLDWEEDLGAEMFGWLEGFNGGPVDVVVRPEWRAGSAVVDLSWPWDEEIVHRDVPVKVLSVWPLRIRQERYTPGTPPARTGPSPPPQLEWCWP